MKNKNGLSLEIENDIIKIESIYSSEKNTKNIAVPLLEYSVSAGFPSSAENYLEKTLDLNELLISHPAATFFVRVSGNSMKGAGINSHDILIVDRALSPSNNKIIIARINDEFTVKRIKIENEKLFLMPDNEQYEPMEITTEMDFEVWGVVRYVIHQL